MDYVIDMASHEVPLFLGERLALTIGLLGIR
jgi:hypothetical protein